MGDESDRLVINVGGVIFETYISTLQNIPDTRLAWLTEGLDPDPKNRKEIFFDRHSGVFVHILNYYRTGKLHTPTDICGPLFEEELNFWGIDEKQMEPCCWESFTKHREAEVNLKSFEGPGFEDLRNAKQRKLSSFSIRDGLSCRERMDQIWSIVDRPHSSNIAKYTSILSCFMIVLSVTVYCLNTLPELKDLSSWINTRSTIDIFCMCWFTLEFAIRVMVCPDRKAFAQSVSNWIDFLLKLPSKDRKLLAGNIRGLLKQPLSLSSRERDRRGLKRNNMPTIRRKGSSKISYKNETEIQVSRSESSGDESIGETSMNAVNSSEECLDWDFSADSKMTFRQASSGQQRSNQRGNRREAVTALLPGSDSDGPVPYEVKKHKVCLGKAKGVGNALLHVPEHDNIVATNEQSSLEDNYRNLVSSLESDKSSVNDDCDLFIKENETCLVDNTGSDPASRRCSSTRGSSRRASMKLMDLNVLPDKCENKILSNDRRRKETITSIDEPFSHQHKKKKIKSKRPSKLPDAKIKNSVPSFGRRRRDGIFTLENMDKKTFNGYLTDSSERDGSPVEPPGLNCSPASPGFENLQNSDMAVLLSVPNSPNLSSNEKIPGELISKLNSLALSQKSVDGTISKDEAGFGLKCKEKRKLSGQSHIVIKHLPRNLNRTGRNLHKTRKISRSESNLRTYYRVFNDVQEPERLPCIRHYASHSDVRLLESGV
eukprot:gene4480-20723_t